MTGDKGNGERWLNIAGSLASLAALGYLLTHLPRRGERSTPVAGLGAAPKSRKLGALPKFPDLTISSRISKSRVGNPDTLIVEAFTANQHEAGHVTAMGGDDYAIVMTAGTSPKYRGVGLYPVMLTMLRDLAKERGYKGIVSEGEGRIDAKSTRAWEKFAAREPRVRRQGEDFYLDGLPTKGRIPLATAKRAINRLGRKAKACGITPALLREGMEVEREHRDVTGGRVGTTAKIAAAHICEDKQYYRKLKRYIEK